MALKGHDNVSATRDSSVACKLLPVPSLCIESEGIVPRYDREYENLVRTVKEVRKERRREEKEARQEKRDEQNKVLTDKILEAQSISAAARAAGITPSAAKNRLRCSDVCSMLREGRQEIAKITTIKRLDVLNVFLEAIDMARLMSDPSQMINGADKIAKMMGFYEPEEIKVDVNVNYEGALRKIRELSDVELLELAQGRVIEDVA